MFRFTRHGFKEMLIGSVVLAAVIVGSGWGGVHGSGWAGLYWWPLGLGALLVLVWLFAFFRDPERAIPGEAHVMVSPADGTVSDVTEVEHDELLGGPAVRVGIFLSVFNVHVNRSPCDAKVLSIDYKKGRFINALDHKKASDENESNTVVLGDPVTGRPVAVVKQIVGLIARRIIFVAAVGDSLKRGQRIGMIKFGSRTELSIPKWLAPEVLVKEGQKLRGAADPVARLANALHTVERPPIGEEFERLAPRQTPT